MLTQNNSFLVFLPANSGFALEANLSFSCSCATVVGLFWLQISKTVLTLHAGCSGTEGKPLASNCFLSWLLAQPPRVFVSCSLSMVSFTKEVVGAESQERSRTPPILFLFLFIRFVQYYEIKSRDLGILDKCFSTESYP